MSSAVGLRKREEIGHFPRPLTRTPAVAARLFSPIAVGAPLVAAVLLTLCLSFGSGGF